MRNRDEFTEYTGTIKCNCDVRFLAYVWNEQKKCNEIKCTCCGAGVTERKHKAKERDYQVPLNYQDWKHGGGYRHNIYKRTEIHEVAEPKSKAPEFIIIKKHKRSK